ncbi:MAG TPA: BrxA family protein [Herpetosiphonaceae bacterium]|nr:BrxA family protein [Herpetosiphonaceae bacterium]
MDDQPQGDSQTLTQNDVRWRADGLYLPTNASKNGLVDETRQFLLAYAHLRNMSETRRALVDGELPQRSRATRETIVKVIQKRLVRWNTPPWVFDELTSFAQSPEPAALKVALLLHAARQDRVLYDLVQQVIVPWWRAGETQIIRADVQRFLDRAAADHPEVESWSWETREKLAGNLLTILRDYGLLSGAARKQIVEPIVPLPVAYHLARLLVEEGVPYAELARHPDWRLWLWDEERVSTALAEWRLPEYAR